MSQHMIERIIPIVEDEVLSGRKLPIEAIVETLEYVISTAIIFNARTARARGRMSEIDDIHEQTLSTLMLILTDRFPIVLKGLENLLEPGSALQADVSQRPALSSGSPH